MVTSELLRSLRLLIGRLFIAWGVGGALYFLTAVTTSYDGINTFISGILGGALISAAAVGTCAILGLLLLIPPLGRFWRGSYGPVASVALLGLALFFFSFLPGQQKKLGSEMDGTTIKELGITWPPGYLLVLFSFAFFPLVARPDPSDVD